MVLLRALVGGVEVSLLAREVSLDPLLASHVRIEQVEGVSDPAFPSLRFRDLILPRPAILWYAVVEPIDPEPLLDVERRIGIKTGEAPAPAGDAPPGHEAGQGSGSEARSSMSRYRGKR